MAKWTLTIEEEGGQTHRVELTRDAYTIGRDPSNDIVFRERNISRRHARLERAGPGRWALIDEGSRFGCFINGERLQDRGVISPVDAVHLGGYHLSILSSSGGKRGLQPALSVTRSLLVPLDVPPKLRLFDGLAPVADVRLDRGPVSFGSDSDCTVRLLGVEGALVHIRPLPGGSFEIVDRGDVVLVRLKGQELRRKILENADLFDLGDDLAIRFLQGGRHARADEPNFSPSPLVDLSNGVAEAKVLGVEGVPVLRQGPPKTAASSTLVGLQAPRPPPLPAPPAASPAGAVAWHPEQQDTPTHADGFQPPPSVDPPTTRTPYESSSPRPPQASSVRPSFPPGARPPYDSSPRGPYDAPGARPPYDSSVRAAHEAAGARPPYESSSPRPPAYESPSGQVPYEGGARPPFDSSAGRTAEMPAGRPSHAPLPSRTVELPAGGRPMPQPMRGMTERLAPVPPSQHPQHLQHSQPPPPAPNPMAQSDDSWTPGVPAADMGWPMGQHQPSSVPNPPPDAWWYAGTAGPPGQGFAPQMQPPPPAPPPPMRRGLVALVILAPLSAGILATALLMAKLRPPPVKTTTDETEVTIQPGNQPASSAEPAASAAEPAASAAEPASASASAEPPTAPAAPSDSAAPRPAPGKTTKPAKPLSAEAERLRQLRCQQYGKCDLVRIERRWCENVRDLV